MPVADKPIALRTARALLAFALLGTSAALYAGEADWYRSNQERIVLGVLGSAWYGCLLWRFRRPRPASVAGTIGVGLAAFGLGLVANGWSLGAEFGPHTFLLPTIHLACIALFVILRNARGEKR